MKNIKISQLIIGLMSAITLVGCNNGSSSSSNASATEKGVAVFTQNASVTNSNIWIATQPSSGNWQQYMSGTAESIIALGATSSQVLAFDGTNIILSNTNNSQFTSSVFPTTLTNATITAGQNQFALYSGSNVWNISNQGVVSSSYSFSTNISSIKYFSGVFYAYLANSQVYTSSDGINWTLSNGAQNVQAFTNVIQLNTNLYAAMTAPDLGSNNPNLWLGSSPTNFNSVAINNFFGVPAQVNFIATNGNGSLYLNETIGFTQKTIREYFIQNSSQVSTNAIVQVISLPDSLSGTQKPTALYFANNNIYLNSGTIATTSNPTNNLIDPTEPSALTVAQNVNSANVTTQLVNNQSQANGTLSANQGNNLIVAPGDSSNNGGALTMITSVANSTTPSYNVLPTGTGATYAALIGSISQYMLVFNNGGILLGGNNNLQPSSSITNTSNSSLSVPVTKVTSAASIGGTYLVQASSTSSDLYFSQNGSSWGMISQAALTTANLGTLAESAISSNSYGGLYYIQTSTGNYQTATPSSLSTWVSAPSPTPLFQMNNNQYTFYINTNNLGTLGSNNQYTVTTNVLPQNYESSGNVAYNGQTIALAQGATIVYKADKYAGSNYIWTNTNLSNTGWVLNIANFTTNSGQALANEFFNVAPVLLWTGKVWVTEGNGNTLLNPNYLPGNIYISQNVTTWQAANSNSAPITGKPVLF